MKQRWSLYFEQLGSIEQGAVRIAPMMLFTGDNNAGKSYVMALLWGVVALGRDLLFPEEPPESESFRLCDQWLLAHAGEDVDIDAEAERLFVNWFGDTLNHRRKRLCDAIFGEGRIQPKVLRVRDYVRVKPLRLRWDTEPVEGGRYSSGKDYIRFPVNHGQPTLASRYRMIRYLAWNLLMGDLSAPLFQMMQPLNPAPKGEILYLPASRTGFMLMRKVLASGLLGLGGGDAMPLNMPTRRFIQRLLSLSHAENGKYGEIATRIEAEILFGDVRPDSSPLPDYHYRPAGSDGKAIPFWLSSSLVTELSPLLMFLRSTEDFRSLIIEEPEAHLHLELQSRLARALARLVNAGLPVWLTTHGDTFFQQLSNLVKASQLDRNKLATLGIDKAETLAPDQVCAWQFKVRTASGQRHSTQIRALNVDENGIAAAAFNESIAALTHLTLQLDALGEAGNEA